MTLARQRQKVGSLTLEGEVFPIFYI
jgi:hypothetical protein